MTREQIAKRLKNKIDQLLPKTMPPLGPHMQAVVEAIVIAEAEMFDELFTRVRKLEAGNRDEAT